MQMRETQALVEKWTHAFLILRCRSRLLASITLMLSITVSGCCRSFDSNTTTEDKAAHEWLHVWQDSAAWQKLTGWREVKDPSLSIARTLLAEKPYIALTEQQVYELTGTSNEHPPGNGFFYLLRALGAVDGKFPLELFTRPNGEVWVGGQAISRCPVPIQRRAVIVWLETPPKQVYVTFLVAR
jgi:hypothetical protein